ncbi:MAG TPA: hypothetical protein VIF09_10385 [Polyangiaceae bacterium]|jgi:hypothetical protein
MRVTFIAIGALTLVGVAAACGGEVDPTYGPPNGLDKVQPPTPGNGSTSSGGSTSGGSSSGSSSSGSSGTTSSSGGTTSSSGGHPADGGASSGGDGQVTQSCTVSWKTNVFPLFESTGAGTCGNAACHGGTNPPTVVDNDPATTYKNFSVYNINGKPVFKTGDANPSDSTIECDLGIQTPICGIAAMPEAPGVLAAADRTTIDTWVKCGAPNN